MNGQSVKVPAGVGIADPQTEPTQSGPFVGAGACFSWLHTHAADGIIHIESPVHRAYQLEVGKPLVAPVQITNWYGL